MRGITADRCRCFWLPLVCCLIGLAPEAASAEQSTVLDTSPVDIALSGNGQWLVTANQTSNTVSLVSRETSQVVDSQPCGEHPVAVVIGPDGQSVFVSCQYSGELSRLQVVERDADGKHSLKLERLGDVRIGFEPHGVAVSSDGSTAYVARKAAHDVAVVDLDANKVTNHIKVGRWPRYVALSSDDARLAVGTSGTSGDDGISVVDTQRGELDYIESVRGINIGHLHVSRDDRYVYFPWMVYRTNPITFDNIRRGWVLGSRIARVRLDGSARREAITLDPRGEAVADPHGIAITSDEQTLIASAPGTHELLAYRLPDLPLKQFGGSVDHIDPALLRDRDRFFRIPLGGRPMGIRVAADNRTVYVANYLSNAVQVVDLTERKVVGSIPLGGPAEPSPTRLGEAFFYDARRSLDQWYSCHTCHYEGGSNSVVMDTLNDGTNNSFKTVLPLYNVLETSPWTWHGWQRDLVAAVHKSTTTTMLGPKPTDEDVNNLVSYLETLEPPPNPFRRSGGSLSEAARRGKHIFGSERIGCAVCHTGPHFTDGEVHDVGLGSSDDLYEGFNTPSLVGVHGKVRFLHDGRAKTLKDVLTGDHRPSKTGGTAELSADELQDLIAYLRSL